MCDLLLKLERFGAHMVQQGFNTLLGQLAGFRLSIDEVVLGGVPSKPGGLKMVRGSNF